MSRLPAFLLFSIAFVGAFLTVGFSVSVASMRLTKHEGDMYFWPSDGWTDIAFLKVDERTQRAWLGKYEHIRSRLDYDFHNAYSRKRVMLQDEIIDSMLTEHDASFAQMTQNCTRTAQPWLIFTAGAMGAGKSHTIKVLHQKGRFPLQSFITVDPDQIRHRLPEFESYVEHDPQNAGELTRKEAGLIAEVLTEAALERRYNVLVDGSLRDADWYMTYIQSLRQNLPLLHLAILHVTAPREAVFRNALVRRIPICCFMKRLLASVVY